MRFDALGEQYRPGPFRVGHDGGHRPAQLAIRAVLDEPHVELHDVGLDDRQEGQRRRIDPDVVERDQPAAFARRDDAGEELCGCIGDGSFGDLEHDRALPGRGDGGGPLDEGGVEGRRLDVDEDRDAGR